MTKRSPAPDPPILEANGVRLNLTTREAVCDGISADLTPAEFDILEVLMRHAGRVVSKDALGHALEGNHVNPAVVSLDAHVDGLKRKLERGRRVIRIIEGGGYLFVAVDEHGATGYQLA